MSFNYDCDMCGQDTRLPPINFQRMEWILKLFSKIADEDQQWVIERLSSDLHKNRSKPKRKRKK